MAGFPVSKQGVEQMNKSQNQSGFTLVELTVVLVVIGLLLASAAPVLKIYLLQKRDNEMKETTRAVRTALSNFIEVNDRYPCPAPLDISSLDPQFGQEQIVNPGQPTQSCDPSSSGVSYDAGLNVYVGAVPARTLDLEMGRTLDPYGNRFTYAISGPHAGMNGMVNPSLPGTISIIPPLATGMSPQFALVSHGLDGAGSFTPEGVANAITCADASTEQQENCDLDGTLTEIYQSYGTLYYDDISYFTLIDDDPDGWWKQASGTPNDIINKNSGNVGIGTLAPQAKLDVQGDASVSGNVGIGTLTPQTKLDVQGDASVSGNVGIGITPPETKLDVMGEVKIGNTGLACTVSRTGATRYNAAKDQMEYCAEDKNAQGVPVPAWKPFGTNLTLYGNMWPTAIICSDLRLAPGTGQLGPTRVFYLSDLGEGVYNPGGVLYQTIEDLAMVGSGNFYSLGIIFSSTGAFISSKVDPNASAGGMGDAIAGSCRNKSIQQIIAENRAL